MKNSNCPNCNAKFGLRQIAAYSSLWGVRRTKPCPHCGVLLRWALKPFMLMNLGSIILISAAISVFALSERLFYYWNTPTILFAIGAAITLVSLPLMRLENVNN